MTTYTNFAPNTIAPFTFQPTLDGDVYTATVTWNLFGRRWYLNIADEFGNPILSTAMVGSPNGWALTSIAWANGVVTARIAGVLALRTGTVVVMTIAGCTPDAYNFSGQCAVVSPNTVTFPLSLDPGPITAIGQAAYNVNLVAGYFEISSLVWRVANNQFEVSP